MRILMIAVAAVGLGLVQARAEGAGKNLSDESFSKIESRAKSLGERLDSRPVEVLEEKHHSEWREAIRLSWLTEVHARDLYSLAYFMGNYFTYTRRQNLEPLLAMPLMSISFDVEWYESYVAFNNSDYADTHQHAMILHSRIDDKNVRMNCIMTETHLEFIRKHADRYPELASMEREALKALLAERMEKIVRKSIRAFRTVPPSGG